MSNWIKVVTLYPTQEYP